MTGSAVPGFTSTLLEQDAEKVRQRRSRFAQKLNVPKRTPRLFARCGLAWDKARLARQGWEGEKVAFLSILRAVLPLS